MKAIRICSCFMNYICLCFSQSRLVYPYVSFIPGIGIIPEKVSAPYEDYRNKTKFLNRNDQNFLFAGALGWLSR